MGSRSTPYVVLVLVLIGALVFALMRRDEAPPAASAQASAANAPPLEAPADPHAEMALPPDHPPIGSGDPAMFPSSEEPAALTWKVPDAWKTVPSTSSMRIATYRVPRAPADTEDSDLSVTRAGGGTEANIERWIGQFDEAGQDKRTEKMVRGLKITTVEVSGTFVGGGMMGGASGPKKGWALLGAIVETPGSPYFFKLTGPAASVRAARPAFDALLASVTPSDGG